MTASAYEEILVHINEDTHLGTVTLNKPKRLNIFTKTAYHEVSRALQQLDADDRVRVVLLAAKGRFFSAGTQLLGSGGIMTNDSEGGDLEKKLRETTWDQARRLTSAMIELRKPLIVALQGPVVGIACTTLLLADIVYASDAMWMKCPFMELGLCAEGISSMLFQDTMGRGLASEMLLMGEQLTADEAQKAGFVARVFPHQTFQKEVMKRANKMASYPIQALQITKELMQGFRRPAMRECMDRELNVLIGRFMSEEAMIAVGEFVMRQAEKKEKRKKQKQTSKL